MRRNVGWWFGLTYDSETVYCKILRIEFQVCGMTLIFRFLAGGGAGLGDESDEVTMIS